MWAVGSENFTLLQANHFFLDFCTKSARKPVRQGVPVKMQSVLFIGGFSLTGKASMTQTMHRCVMKV